jgi:hypothetical protein
MPRHRSADPPHTLVARLERLNDSLLTLGDRLKEAISSTIGEAASEAVRDAVLGLLGSSPQGGIRGDHPRPTYEEEDDWAEHDHLWPQEGRPTLAYGREPLGHPSRGDGPWGLALTAMAQAGLTWVRQNTTRRPFLTVVLAVLSAGATALLAGPALGAGAGVIASIAGLILIADSVAAAVGELTAIGN